MLIHILFVLIYKIPQFLNYDLHLHPCIHACIHSGGRNILLKIWPLTQTHPMWALTNFLNWWNIRFTIFTCYLCGWRLCVPVTGDASFTDEVHPVVVVLPSQNKSAGPSPVVGAGARKGSVSISSEEWPTSPDEDNDRLVAIHLQQTGLSTSLGVSILTAGREDQNSLSQPLHIN